MNKRVGYVFLGVGVGLLFLPLLPKALLRFQPRSTVPRAAMWTLPVPVQLKSLNPQVVITAHEKSLLLLSFSRLVRIDEELQIQPDLVKEWKYITGERTILFSLREDVHFHDGKPLLVDDVIFSLHEWARKEFLDSDLLTPIEGVADYQSGRKEGISGIKKISDYQFSVTLTHWVDSFVRVFSLPRFCVFPKVFGGKSRENYFKNPVGTGPYRLRSLSLTESFFDSFDGYHLGNPLTKTIEVLYIPSEDALAAFNHGLVDNLIMYDLAPEPNHFHDPRVVVTEVRSTGTMTLVYNAGNTYLQPSSVRDAIAVLIDRARLVEKCLPRSVVAEHLISPGMLGSSGKLSGFPAAVGIEKSDLSKLPPMTLYVSREDPSSSCLRGELTQMFRGTPISVDEAKYEKLFDLLKQKSLHLWVELLVFKNEDPLSVLQYFSQTSNEYLLGREIPALQNLFDRLSRTKSEQQRVEIYHEIDLYLTEHRYVYPLAYLPSFSITRRNVKGLESVKPKRFVGNWHLVFVEKTNE